MRRRRTGLAATLATVALSLASCGAKRSVYSSDPGQVADGACDMDRVR
ncbi:hypothetical protein [Micromonospora sp. WMMD1219]